MWRWEGTAFGDIQPIESPTTVNLRFPGQYADVESGLYYNWNRYYDPRTGRYITSDHVGLFGGLNSYAYGFNNPTLYSDPWGLWALGAHWEIILDFARRNGFSRAQARAMWLGTLFADSFLYWSNHVHAMRDSDMSREEACRKAREFLERWRKEYTRRLEARSMGGILAGNPYFALGLAMHTVMDSWSPAHYPFRIYLPSDSSLHGGGRRSAESLDDLRNRPDLLDRIRENMDRLLRGERPQLPGCECDGDS